MHDKSKSSWVWLKGTMCSPSRLPLAIVFSLRGGFRALKMNPPRPQDWTIIGLGLGTFFSIYMIVALLDSPMKELKEQSWVASLAYNLLSYSAIFLPGYLILKYVMKTNFLETGPKLLSPVIRLCFFGNDYETLEESISESQSGKKEPNKEEKGKGLLPLLGCFVGIQVCYLTWGLLQEKIMTKQYVDSTGQVGQFKDSQFIVFVNRIMAFAVGLFCITVLKMPRHRAPLYKYSYCSFSNIFSSWCQYEALKFVSFPTQVLAKASKVIPVMIMGRIISKKTYEKYEYIVAILISVGMFLFLSGSPEAVTSKNVAANGDKTTTISGFILLVGYMASDAFTSNWQDGIFNDYNTHQFQMMCCVNLFSCLLTSVSLFQQGTFFDSLVFMSQFPGFTFDCIVVSFCSAFGQIFIFYTIKNYGAVTFVIIMTLRQAIAILLSCYTYGHVVTVMGAVGVIMVFAAVFFKIYMKEKLKRQKKQHEAASAAQSLTTKDQSSA